MKKINICLIILTLLIPAFLSACPAQNSNQAVNIKFDKEFLDKLKSTDNGTKSSSAPTSSSSSGSTSTAKQWSADEITTFKTQCSTSALQSSPNSSQQLIDSYCSCAQSKIQANYTFSETSKMSVSEFQSIAQTCLQQATSGQSSTGSAWSSTAVDAFVSQCSSSVYVSYPNAESNVVYKYCTCTQSKIAEKYSYVQLQNVTAIDLQSAANTCTQQLL